MNSIPPKKRAKVAADLLKGMPIRVVAAKNDVCKGTVEQVKKEMTKQNELARENLSMKVMAYHDALADAAIKQAQMIGANAEFLSTPERIAEFLKTHSVTELLELQRESHALYLRHAEFERSIPRTAPVVPDAPSAISATGEVITVEAVDEPDELREVAS